MKSYKWVDQWLKDEQYDPNNYNSEQKKMFAEIVKNGPQTYKDLKTKFKIARNSVHDRLKPFIQIGWIIKNKGTTPRGRPIVIFSSIYEIDE